MFRTDGPSLLHNVVHIQSHSSGSRVHCSLYYRYPFCVIKTRERAFLLMNRCESFFLMWASNWCWILFCVSRTCEQLLYWSTTSPCFYTWDNTTKYMPAHCMHSLQISFPRLSCMGNNRHCLQSMSHVKTFSPAWLVMLGTQQSRNVRQWLDGNTILSVLTDIAYV